MGTKFLIQGELEYEESLDDLEISDVESSLASVLESDIESYNPAASWVEVTLMEDNDG